MHRIGFFGSLASAVALVLLSHSAMAQGAAAASTGSNDAGTAARNFLSLIDAGQYAESWDGAAGVLRSEVKRDSWVAMLTANRRRFGDLVNRTMESDEPTTSAPGLPDGKYQIVTYGSSFSARKRAIETVVATLDDDGKWRVLRYSVKQRK